MERAGYHRTQVGRPLFSIFLERLEERAHFCGLGSNILMMLSCQYRLRVSIVVNDPLFEETNRQRRLRASPDRRNFLFEELRCPDYVKLLFDLLISSKIIWMMY